MMLVDCTTCPVRDVHCADCVVTALTTPSPLTTTLPLAPAGGRPVLREAAADGADAGMALDRAERRAVSVLLAAGLVDVGVANAARAVASSGVGQRTAPAAVQHSRDGSSRAAG